MKYLLLLAAGLASCYQSHSDEALHLVPSTNNPHIIQDSSKTASAPGMGY
jgi:hypothetical protein